MLRWINFHSQKFRQLCESLNIDESFSRRKSFFPDKEEEKFSFCCAGGKSGKTENFPLNKVNKSHVLSHQKLLHRLRKFLPVQKSSQLNGKKEKKKVHRRKKKSSVSHHSRQRKYSASCHSFVQSHSKSSLWKIARNRETSFRLANVFPLQPLAINCKFINSVQLQTVIISHGEFLPKNGLWQVCKVWFASDVSEYFYVNST